MSNHAARDREAALQFQKEPPRDNLADRKERFAALVRFISRRGGWVTSIPGDTVVSFEALPGTDLADQVRALGLDVHEDGETERILPAAIVERFCHRADGSLELLTPESTAAVAETRYHAGIVKVQRYAFSMP